MKASVRAFLQTWDEDKDTQYVVAFDDLNADGKPEPIVYLLGPGWCGSGGCNTLVLTPEEHTWRIVGNVTITNPPVRVLDRRSKGWKAIAVEVRGGGVRRGYEAALDFDGRTYPRNPTMAPARRLKKKVSGTVLIASTKGAERIFPEPQNAGDSDKLITAHYIVIITSHCAEGVVDCNDVTYHGVSRKTGQGITLKGTTMYAKCADGVTPCHFLGYEFENGNITYQVLESGRLRVFRGEGDELLNENGQWQ